MENKYFSVDPTFVETNQLRFHIAIVHSCDDIGIVERAGERNHLVCGQQRGAQKAGERAGRTDDHHNLHNHTETQTVWV